jgi:hypothetical protein
MIQRRIYIYNAETSPSVYFDTGLDPRSFARTKMSQCLIEPGYIVSSDGTHEVWKAAGVNEINGFMRVWGPMVSGERLDLLLDEIDSSAKDASLTRQTALQAVISWAKAKMFLGETQSALNPGASFIFDSKVFFAPEHLSNRCLFVEGITQDKYNCPDLSGIDAAAFCVGVMLYKILTGFHPYSSAEIYQNMREGVFLPLHLSAPSLNETFSDLIQSALFLPVAKNRTKNGTDILRKILEILTNTKTENTDTSLFIELPSEKKVLAEKEMKRYQFKQNIVVRTKRFAVRHRPFIIGISVCLIVFFSITFSILSNFSQRTTTRGMTPNTVVFSYYDAFNTLDHLFMDASIMRTSRNDINLVASFSAASKAKQAYENTDEPLVFSAREWEEIGGELPARNIFGITNINIEHLAGSESDGMVIYHADYILWTPDENSRNRSDIVTLRRDRRNNWRITEILRTER